MGSDVCGGDELKGASDDALGQLGGGKVGHVPCPPAVKTVTPIIVLGAHQVVRNADGTTPSPVAVTLRIDADHPEIPYSGTITLSRSHPRVQLIQVGQGSFAGQNLQSQTAIHGLTVSQSLALTAEAVADGTCRLTFALEDPGDPQIVVRDPAVADLTVVTVNEVTVHLEVEYLVVPAFRSVAGRQTDLVRAEVWITQTQPGIGYTGAVRVVRSNANLRAYTATDGSGQEGFAVGGANHFDIPNASINAGQRVVFYLQGAAAGQVQLTAGLQQLGRADTREGNNVTVPMSVVDLAATLHRDAASPAPGAMTTQDKITIGGLAMVQNAQGHRGRLRLSIPAPSADVWHVGAADYEVVVSVEAAHGAIELFDHATNGAIGTGLALPLRLREADFLAGPKDLWIQGRTVANGWRGIKIDIGLDRPMGGLAKTPKRHGDWALVTVFDIAQLTPTAAARQHINLDTDHAHHPHRGRTFRTAGTLTPALQNVAILFKLVPDAANKAGLPAAQVHQDPNVPVRSTTDAHGVATADLLLSRYGGDIFRIGAYLEEDATAGAAHPVVSSALTVWRRIFYELYCMARAGGGNFGNRIDEPGFQGEFAASFVEAERVGPVHALANDRVVVFNNFAAWAGANMPALGQPRTVALGFIDTLLNGPQAHNVQIPKVPGGAIWQSPPTAGQMYNLNDQTTWLDSVGFPPRYRTAAVAQGPVQNLMGANAAIAPIDPAQGGGVRLSVNLTGQPRNVDFVLTVLCQNTATGVVGNHPWSMNNVAPGIHDTVINGFNFDPANWFVSLNVRIAATAAGPWQLIPLVNIDLVAAGDDFRLRLNFQQLGNVDTYDVELRLHAYATQDFKGAQNGVSTVVAVREIERAMVGQENATARQAMQHEVGHYLGLGSRELFDGSPNANYYDNPGVGPHCNHGPDTCVMRHDLTNPPNTIFCPVCRVLLRARDMSNPNASTTVAFPA